MDYYKQQTKIWKNEWRGARKNTSVSFNDFLDEKLAQLSESDAEKFKEYCAGYGKSLRMKHILLDWGVALGSAFVIGATLGGLGLLPTSLWGWIGWCAGVVCVSDVAGFFASKRYFEERQLVSCLVNKNFLYRRSLFSLLKRNKEKNYSRILNREAFMKSEIYSKYLKRSRIPKTIQKYFQSLIKSDEKTDSAIPNNNFQQSKDDRKKEWYKENFSQNKTTSKSGEAQQNKNVALTRTVNKLPMCIEPKPELDMTR